MFVVVFLVSLSLFLAFWELVGESGRGGDPLVAQQVILAVFSSVLDAGNASFAGAERSHGTAHGFVNSLRSP